MKCPDCGNLYPNFSIVETRRSKDKVRRRRKCNKCGLRFSTLETIVELKKGNNKAEYKTVDLVLMRSLLESARRLTLKANTAVDNAIEQLLGEEEDADED